MASDKDILTGIPKVLPVTPGRFGLHQSHHAGDDRGCWRPGVGRRSQSLTGKVLRIEQPTTIGQTPTLALSGIGSSGSLCIDRSRLAICRRPHANGGPIAAHRKTPGGLYGMDLAGQARRGGSPRWTAPCWST